MGMVVVVFIVFQMGVTSGVWILMAFFGLAGDALRCAVKGAAVLGQKGKWADSGKWV